MPAAAMGLLQGARRNPGAPEDEEWGLQSPLAGLWFGRFCPCAPRASPVWRLREWATSSHVITDLELPAIPHSFLAAGWLGLEIAWPPQGCVPRGADVHWEDLSVRVGLRRP